MSIHTNEDRNAETNISEPATDVREPATDVREPATEMRGEAAEVRDPANPPTSVVAPEDRVSSQRTGDADEDMVLIDNTDGFRSRWESVQIGFVDDPRLAVQDAQQLLSAVVDELVDGFRRQLDETLQNPTDAEASTDQMRYTFRRYRVLFERLLTT